MTMRKSASYNATDSIPLGVWAHTFKAFEDAFTHFGNKDCKCVSSYDFHYVYFLTKMVRIGQ